MASTPETSVYAPNTRFGGTLYDIATALSVAKRGVAGTFSVPSAAPVADEDKKASDAATPDVPKDPAASSTFGVPSWAWAVGGFLGVAITLRVLKLI